MQAFTHRSSICTNSDESSHCSEPANNKNTLMPKPKRERNRSKSTFSNLSVASNVNRPRRPSQFGRDSVNSKRASVFKA